MRVSKSIIFDENNKILPNSQYIIFSAILTTFMCYNGSSANIVGSFIVVVLCFLFSKKPEFLLPVVLISSLLGDYFVAIKGVGMSRLTLLVYIALSSMQMIFKKQRVSLIATVMLVVSAAFCIISSLFSLTGALTPAITLVLNLLLTYFMSYQLVENRESFIQNFKICLWVFALFMFFNIIVFGNLHFYGNRLIFYNVGSNALGMCLSQVAVFLIVFSYFDKNKVHSFISLFCALTSSYLLMLTGSRSSALAAIVAVIVLLFVGFRGKFSAKYILLIIGIVFAVVGLYFLLKEHAPDIIRRFTVEDITHNGGSNRLEIWKATLLYVIPENWIVGVGLGGDNTVIAMEPYVSHALGVHNLYISLLTQVGTIGSLLFYGFWVRNISNGLRYQRQDPFLKVPLYLLLASFINGIGEDVFNERFVWFSAGLIFLTIYNNKHGNWREKDEISFCC